MNTPALRLFSAPDCCLCTEMKAILERVRLEIPFNLLEADISGDAALEAQFRTEIPVLFLGETKIAKYRITAEALRRALRARG